MPDEVSESVGRLLGVDVVSVQPVGGDCFSDARRVELADGRAVFGALPRRPLPAG